MAWDDDKKAQVIKMYQDAEPTPANSLEVVKEIAEEVGETANGVRMILTRAGVYIKKEEGSKPANGSKASGGEGKSARVSKEDAHAALRTAIENSGGKVDDEIIGKLTGKAALYLAEVVKSASNGTAEDEE